MSAIGRVRLRVEGRVQGVAFRAHTAHEAQALGLSGYVRNLPDGSVEAEIEGPAEAVAALTRWCERGPPMARVTRVSSTPIPPTGGVGFVVRR